MKRTRIGRSSNVATRQVVYRTPVGIEVDELDHFEIVRRRVFYDDVLLVTYHREPGWAFVVVMGIILVLFGTVATLTTFEPAVSLSFAAVAALALLLGGLRVAMKVEVVSVFGRRSKASVHYPWRKAHARRIYAEVCANAAGAQRKLAREIAKNEPPPPETAPAEELPPMPAAAPPENAPPAPAV